MLPLLIGICAGAVYDVVVYGATPGGILAASAAANEGASVVLIHPLKHIGGMSAGGLGATDKGTIDAIGGLTLTFFQNIGTKYGNPGKATYTFEPHIAEDAFHDLLTKVTLVTHKTVTAATLSGKSITSITVIDTDAAEADQPGSPVVYSGKMFIDASYEGDLLPLSKVSYTCGRESAAHYNESLGGRLVVPNDVGGHQFKIPLNYTDDKGHPLPMIYTGDPGKPGDADKKIQAYNFRLCATANKSNMIPFQQPTGYDPAYWELARRYYNAAKFTKLTDVANLGAIPHGKFDMNNNGAISSDYIGASWTYPEATPKERHTLWQKHYLYQASWLWFLSSDSALSSTLRADVSRYGLCADEFTDHKGWPWQLYVREGRRMIGEYVFTQADRQTYLNNKNDSIGLFSYNIDNHNSQRFPQGEYVRNEGDEQKYGSLGPGQMPYRMIVPKKGQVSNLLVPVAASTSHVGFGAIRLEPQWMILGQSAGVAAVQALHEGVAVQDVNIPNLQKRLTALGQKLKWPLGF